MLICCGNSSTKQLIMYKTVTLLANSERSYLMASGVVARNNCLRATNNLKRPAGRKKDRKFHVVRPRNGTPTETNTLAPFLNARAD